MQCTVRRLRGVCSAMPAMLTAHRTLAAVLLLCSLTIALNTIKQNKRDLGDSGCNCEQTDCNCCVDLEPIKSSVCLDTSWNAANKSITVQASFGGFPLGVATFSGDLPLKLYSKSRESPQPMFECPWRKSMHYR